MPPPTGPIVATWCHDPGGGQPHITVEVITPVDDYETVEDQQAAHQAAVNAHLQNFPRNCGQH